MKSLHKYFHWFYYNRGKKRLFSLLISTFFWLFLSITQPFGIYSGSGVESFLILFIWLLPTGVFWFVSIYLIDVVLDVLLKKRQQESVTLDLIGWLIKLMVIIHVIFLFRGYSCDWLCLDVLEYVQLVFACLLIFFLVYLPFANYAKSVYLKSVFSGAELPLKDHELQLGEGKNSLIINLQKVVYIQSDDNHLDIYSLSEVQGVKKEIHRSTLTHMEMLLVEKHPSYKRVHRSYMVNLNYFKTLESSSGSYQILLEAGGQEFKVPVSRKYKSALDELI